MSTRQPEAPRLVSGEVRRVTLSVRSLDASLSLYRDLLGMRVVRRIAFDALSREGEQAAASLGDHAPRALLGPAAPRPSLGMVDLEQPGSHVGSLRLVQLGTGAAPAITDGARAWDHGLVKNLDFFTDDVRGQYARFVAQGRAFLSAPVEYKVPWGAGAIATEVHSAAEDGVKLSLAKMAGVPRIAMGRSNRETPFTEVAAAALVTRDFERAEKFYCAALDLVPAAPTTVEGEIVAALHLPGSTRLRMSFLSGPRAAGGRLGLIAYEGSGVEDARNLSGRARLPFRGVMALAFECADVDRAYARALDLGAREDRTPEERDWDPSVRKASSVLSPDGVRLEFIEPRVRIDPPYGDADAGVGVDLDELAPPSLDDVVSVDSEFDVCEAADLADGAVREFRPKGSPRIAVARLGEEIFAFEDRCPHLGAPLSRGEFRGRVLVCPWHAWSIDVPSGHVVGGGGLHVRHCSARIVNGRIRVGARHRGPA